MEEANMAIKLKRSEYYAIQEDGLYIAEIMDVSACTTKKGEDKVILTLQPRDIENDELYRKLEVWLDIDGDVDCRVNTLLDALPSKCAKNLETAVGEEVGIIVSVNTEKRPAFINVTNFFDIDEDILNADDDLTDDEDEDEEDGEIEDAEDDAETEDCAELEQPKAKYVSPPRRLNSRR